MRRRNVGLTGGAVTLALLASVAVTNAAEVGVCSLIAKPANFDHQTITLQGAAVSVKASTSRRGDPAQAYR
jgi:hypothetical protein